jgi:uncharacterized BrkB/YihY/UPF0761 family membrane protein
MLMASAVAFRLYLWLMPLALLTAGILAGLSGTNAAATKTAVNAAGITGAASQEIISVLHDGDKSWWIAVVLGGFGVLWGANSLLHCLMLVHAHTWQVATPQLRLRDTVITALVFIASWFGLATIGAVTPRLDHVLPAGLVVAILAEVALTTGVWLAVSLRLPHSRESWYDLLPGCVLFGLSFVVLHTVSRTYIPPRLEQSSQLYGALGIAGVLLAWLLVIGQVIVGAALVNVLWAEYRRSSS